MKLTYLLTYLLASATLAGCSALDYKQGGGASPITGSSNVSGGSTGASTTLVKCPSPIGTATLVEPQTLPLYQNNGVSNPAVLVRLLMQQSNCFVVVDRGAALQNIQGERALMKSGELRENSSFGGGQMVAADFSITPNVIFSEDNSGGMSAGIAALGSFVPGGASLIGAVGAGAAVKFKEAQTSLMLIDNRTGVQVAMAEGSTSKGDLSGALGVFGGYANTNANKIIASAFLDTFNNLVSSAKAAGYKYEAQPADALAPQKKKKSN